jgi:hypothetical protein
MASIPRRLPVMLRRKVCPTCGVEQSTSDFLYLGKRYKECESCMRKQHRAQKKSPPQQSPPVLAQRPPERVAEYRRRDRAKRRGVSTNEYQRMFDAQGGVCAICGNPETVPRVPGGPPRQLALDHSHKTSRIRGLLCFLCNTKLGRLRDDLTWFQTAITYLDQYKD